MVIGPSRSGVKMEKEEKSDAMRRTFGIFTIFVRAHGVKA